MPILVPPCGSVATSTAWSKPSWSTPTATTSGTSPSSPLSKKRPSYPAAATLLGAPVTVTGFDYTNEARGLVAICEGSNGTGEVALADLAFPPDTVTAWIHATYRHYLGLQPFPARPRPGLDLAGLSRISPSAGVGGQPLSDRAYPGSRHPREVGRLGRT